MKYLKTYKTFESITYKEINIYCDSDWERTDYNTKAVYIFYNIKNWPELPKNLEKLYCYNKDITSLPDELPINLKILEVASNKLTKLPELPISLKILSCLDNQLTELPDLPKSLSYIEFFQNPLTKLPKGMKKVFIKQQAKEDKEWLIENAFKLLIGSPQYFELLKPYLSEKEIDRFNEMGPENLKNMNQFGMFN